MKRLFKFLKPYWIFVVLAPLAMFLEVAIDLFQPKLLEEIIDVGIMNQNLDVVVSAGTKMLIITFIGVLGGIACVIFSTLAAQNAGADIRRSVFTKVQYLSFAKLDKFGTGSLITRITDDIVQFQQFIMILLRMFVRAPMLFIGSLIMSLLISWKLSLIFLVVIPLVTYLTFAIMKRVLPLFSRVQKEMDNVNTRVRDNLLGIRVVKSFASSRFESSKFEDANEKYTQIAMKAARTMVIIMPLLSLILNLGIVAVIWFGGIQVEAGGMQTGQIMAFVNYLGRMLMSMMMIGMMLVFVSRAQASAKRVAEVLEESEEEDVKAGISHDLRGPIVFENVDFSYDGGGNKILHNLNFTINQGETVAFLGDTGSGKSSLVSLLPRLYEVDSGKILLNGIDIKEISRHELRKNISMVFQEAVLFSGKIKDNISYGSPGASDEEIAKAAEVAQIADFVDTLPEKYDARLSQMATNLSGGQKQRMAIARAVAMRSPILIFDDSTSALDAKTESEVMRAIGEELDCTKIIIAQKISSVVNADRIFLLDDGKIAGSGTHKQLLKESDLYRDIYRSQFGEVGEVNA